MVKVSQSKKKCVLEATSNQLLTTDEASSEDGATFPGVFWNSSCLVARKIYVGVYGEHNANDRPQNLNGR
jgi:hypothetical protein